MNAEWNKDPKSMFNKYWPGWDSKPATKGFTTISKFVEHQRRLDTHHHDAFSLVTIIDLIEFL